MHDGAQKGTCAELKRDANLSHAMHAGDTQAP